ncbi:MinD/ParA family ATP-binding protein [Nocardia sp. X0981]
MSRSNDGLPMLPPWLADTEVTGVGQANFRNYEPPPVQNLPQDEVIPETPEPPGGYFGRRGRGEEQSAAESDKKKNKGWFRNKNKGQPSLEERVGELLPNTQAPPSPQRNVPGPGGEGEAAAAGPHPGDPSQRPEPFRPETDRGGRGPEAPEQWGAAQPWSLSGDTRQAPAHPLPPDQRIRSGQQPYPEPPNAPDRAIPGSEQLRGPAQAYTGAPDGDGSGLPAPGPFPAPTPEQRGPGGDIGTASAPVPDPFQAPESSPPSLPLRTPSEPAPEFDRLRPQHPIPPHPAPRTPAEPESATGSGAPAAGSAAASPRPFLPPPPPLPDPPAADTAAPVEQEPLRRLPDLPPAPGEPSANTPGSETAERATGAVTGEPTHYPEPSAPPDPPAVPDQRSDPANGTGDTAAAGRNESSAPGPEVAAPATPVSNAPRPTGHPAPHSGPPEPAPGPHAPAPAPGDGRPQWRPPENTAPANGAPAQQWRAPEQALPGQPDPRQSRPQHPMPAAPHQGPPTGPGPQSPPPNRQHPAPAPYAGPPPQQAGPGPTWQQRQPPAGQWQNPPPPAQYGAPGPGGPSLDDVAVRRAKKASGHGWRKVVHHASGGRINPGMSAEERRLQELVARIRQPVRGDYRIAVLSLKGGVGKTTTTVGLGSTFASIRGDRVIAVDANPDFGTLSQRVPLQTRSTVRDLLLDTAIERYSDVRRHTSQATSRLEVLASERDPAASEAFNEDEYRAVARILQRFYNIILTDCGTGLMHSAMAGVLQLAHSLVLISPTAIDGAQSASATLDWLSLHGYHHLVQNAVVVINSPRDGTPNIDVQQLRQYFLSRCRAVHMIPFDPHMSEGAEIDLARLKKETKRAYVELAATVADDFNQSYHTYQGG